MANLIKVVLSTEIEIETVRLLNNVVLNYSVLSVLLNLIFQTALLCMVAIKQVKLTLILKNRGSKKKITQRKLDTMVAVHKLYLYKFYTINFILYPFILPRYYQTQRITDIGSFVGKLIDLNSLS